MVIEITFFLTRLSCLSRVSWFSKEKTQVIASGKSTKEVFSKEPMMVIPKPVPREVRGICSVFARGEAHSLTRWVSQQLREALEDWHCPCSPASKEIVEVSAPWGVLLRGHWPLLFGFFSAYSLKWSVLGRLEARSRRGSAPSSWLGFFSAGAFSLRWRTFPCPHHSLPGNKRTQSSSQGEESQSNSVVDPPGYCTEGPSFRNCWEGPFNDHGTMSQQLNPSRIRVFP